MAQSLPRVEDHAHQNVSELNPDPDLDPNHRPREEDTADPALARHGSDCLTCFCLLCMYF